MATLLGVLVAGGRGARLGLDVPKALVRVAGRSLLDRSLDCLAALCDHVVVAAPATMELELPRGNGGPRPRVTRATDPVGGEGPLAGLVAGMGSESFERAIVLGVDFPLILPSTLAALVAHLGAFGSAAAEGPSAVVPAPRGVSQPLAAAYAAAARDPLERAFASGERSVVAAVASLDPVLLRDDELEGLPGGLESFFNLNTASDLAEAERRLAARKNR
jgi:molybdopterin-guanine dinucleotide biosynthesis protein A